MNRVLIAAASSIAGAAALVAVATVPASAAPTAVPKFKNCATMNRTFPHGVGKVGAHDKVSSGTPVTNFTRSNKIYAANKARDRDKDGVACEKH